MERNRVEDIKKKFEGLNQPVKNVKKEPYPDRKISTNRLQGTSANIHEAKHSLNAARGNIKRSHAFRSEKPLKGHSAEEPCDNIPFSSQKFDYRKSQFEKNHSLDTISQRNNRNKIITGNSSINFDLVQKESPCTSRVLDSIEISPKRSEGSTKRKKKSPADLYTPVRKGNRLGNDQLDKTQGKRNNISEEKKTSPGKLKNPFQKSQSPQAANNLTDSVNFLSNTLKAALSAPLPQGPPPKKPPRTFAHNLKSNEDRTSPNKLFMGEPSSPTKSFNPNIKPVRSKTESQIMLKKLEDYLLSHQGTTKHSAVIYPRKSSEENSLNVPLNGRDDIKRNFEIKPLPRLPSDSGFLKQECFLTSLNCTRPVYEDLKMKKSMFFVSTPKLDEPDLELEKSVGDLSMSYGLIKRSASEEHIYAEPEAQPVDHVSQAQMKGGRDGTVLKCATIVERSTRSLTKSKHFSTRPRPEKGKGAVDCGLHYMCTPIDDAVRDIPVGSVRHATEAINMNVKLLDESKSEKNCFAEPLSTECQEEMDKRNIHQILNDVYNKTGREAKTSERSSDSDSVISSPDEEPQQSPTSTAANQNRDREQMTAERKGYVRRVSRRATSVRLPPHLSPDSFPHLFECVLLVGLDLDPSRCKVPYIKNQFPENVSPPPGVESLCFPDAEYWPPLPEAGQSYTQVLTDSDGFRRYGYCRRVRPEGAVICLPLVYCIITPFKATTLYNKVLVELESRHGQSDIKFMDLIKQLYNCPFPQPGQVLCVPLNPNSECVEIVRRPRDPRQEDVDLADLFAIIKLSVFLQIFATLLHERKVVLVSNSVSKLSACVEGLLASLYPFQWQHTLVPILPSIFSDVCEAPTPYLIGIIKSKFEVLPLKNVDLDLVVDVDTGSVIHSKGDEGLILPSRLSRALRSALQISSQSKPEVANVLASEGLIRLFVELVGHYRDHILVSVQTRQRDFQRETFIKGGSTRSVQLFLEWFTETAMFNDFIESRLERSAKSRGLFEQRCAEFAEEGEYSGGRQLLGKGRNYRALNKTVKTLGDRFKDWAALS